MYNEELKKRYIAEQIHSVSVARVCEALFETLAPYEEEWGADICTRSAEEIDQIINKIVSFRVSSIYGRIKYINNYVSWCIETNVPGACDGIFHIKANGAENIKKELVSCPAQLQKFLDEICNPVSWNTTDCIYRCYCWLAYGGMRDNKEILKVKCSDVDLENMIVHVGDDEIIIYREALPAFRNASTMKDFVYKHPLYEVKHRPRIPGDTLIRGIRGKIDTTGMKNELCRRIKKSRDAGNDTLKLGHYKIWLSGVFYRMHEQELLGLPIDFSPIVEDMTEGREYSLGRTVTMKSKKKQMEKEYEADYERWKTAFFK